MNEDVLECVGCGFSTPTMEVARYQTDEIPVTGQFVFDPSEIDTCHTEYTLRFCPKCKSPFLLASEYVNHHEAGEYKQGQKLLYPHASTNLLTLEAIPDPIAKIYSKAKECFEKSLYEPSAIMTRKCLEAICRDFGATGKSLAEKITSIRAKNRIDDRLQLWATELRLIGNDAAHDLEIEISRQDAEDSLAFLNALLLYVYTLDAKYNIFIARRKRDARH